MALGSGFRRTACPLILIEKFANKQIIPLGKGGQANPIYTARPDQTGSKQIVPHCNEKILTIENVQVVPTYRHGIFLAAQLPSGWINIWNGHALNSLGTLYCDVVDITEDATQSTEFTGKPSFASSSSCMAAALTSADSHEVLCAICLQDLSWPTNALLCGHSFHADCIRLCLQTRTTCPVCRHDSWIILQKHCGCRGCQLPWFLDGWICAAYYKRSW